MICVDLFDYDKIGVLITAKSLFKKWYKQGFLEIMDFILVNILVAWNMSMDISSFIQEKVII